jgi:hypothetical protein
VGKEGQVAGVWWTLFGWFSVECGSALLCRFGFSFCPWFARKTKQKTKAAEQSTAALQTKPQTPLLPASQKV